MLISGQFTMKPVAWNVLLSVPAGVMLCACVPTRASALAKSVWRSRLARGTESFPLDQVNVPHRAVIELSCVVRHILQDIQRRFLVQDGGIQALALNIVLAGLAIGEGNQALAGAPMIDE